MEAGISNESSSADRVREKNITIVATSDKPLPFRIYSGSEVVDKASTQSTTDKRRRRKSTHTPVNLAHIPSWRVADRSDGDRHPVIPDSDHDPAIVSMPVQSLASNPTPPITPLASKTKPSTVDDSNYFLEYDFSKIDYEIARAKKIGQGLWSNVFLATTIAHSPKPTSPTVPTPPSTPQPSSTKQPCGIFAIKRANGTSAKKVFYHEAKILTKLQSFECSYQYIVPFHGLDERQSPLALVFEGIDSTSGRNPSLEGFVNGLTTMTEPARYKELRAVFLGVAHDLIDGLRFIHASGIVHADVKPANVLLDVQCAENASQQPMLRARYIDFSSSFVCTEDATNAGGTWEFMAPEQIQSDKKLSKPSFASDVWSLGVTLLFTIFGRSPWPSAYDNNLFQLRELIKKGEVLKNALEDHKQRIETCQDFVDGCKAALRKDRDSRISALEWLEKFDKLFVRD